MSVSRRTFIAAGALAALPIPAFAQEKVVRFGISMADVPLTTGQPDRGAGAYKFTGYTLYDPLVAWEMDISDRPGKLIPGLATEWKVDDADKTLWVFKLRDGVKFHDGSAFNADAVIWNFDKVFDTKAPQFDQRQASQVRPRLPSVASYRKIDDMTVGYADKSQYFVDKLAEGVGMIAAANMVETQEKAKDQCVLNAPSDSQKPASAGTW